MQFDPVRNQFYGYVPQLDENVRFKFSRSISASHYDQQKAWIANRVEAKRCGIGAHKIASLIEERVGFEVDRSFRDTFKSWMAGRGEIYGDDCFEAIQKHTTVQKHLSLEHLSRNVDTDTAAIVLGKYLGYEAGKRSSHEHLNLTYGMWHTPVKNRTNACFSFHDSVTDIIYIVSKNSLLDSSADIKLIHIDRGKTTGKPMRGNLICLNPNLFLSFLSCPYTKNAYCHYVSLSSVFGQGEPSLEFKSSNLDGFHLEFSSMRKCNYEEELGLLTYKRRESVEIPEISSISTILIDKYIDSIEWDMI